jgi:hypothetical protein
MERQGEGAQESSGGRIIWLAGVGWQMRVRFRDPRKGSPDGGVDFTATAKSLGYAGDQ